MLHRRLSLALAAALLSGCAAADDTCREAPAAGPASSPTGWIEVTAPRDLALLEAPARVTRGDREAVLQPVFRAQIVRFHAQPGDRVRAGQPIVDVIMPEVVDAAAVYRGATRRRTVHGARRDKLNRLRGEGLVSEGAIFEVASLAAESDLQVLAAAATLRAAGVDPAHSGEIVARPALTLSTPIDGVVRDLGGRLGEVVDGQGRSIATIVGEGHPRVEGRFLHEPPAGARLQFMAVDGTTRPLIPVPLGRVVESDDGAVVLWFDVADDRPAFPGLRGTIEVVSDDSSVVQVPAGALQRRDSGLAVVRRRGEEVDEVAVELLASAGAAALVRAREADALVAGDRVADDAAALARAGLAGAAR